MTYVTKTGSVYEVDEVNRRVRRISGTAPPTPGQGNDGEWRVYEQIHHLVDRCLFIDWGNGKGTITSPVSYFGKEGT